MRNWIAGTLAGLTSLFVDAGAVATVPAGTVIDLDGNPRFVDDPTVADAGAGTAPLVDRGAFERQLPAPCAGDLDANGTVDAADIAALLSNWGGSGVGDVTGDGTVNAQDIAAMLSNWGPCTG